MSTIETIYITPDPSSNPKVTSRSARIAPISNWPSGTIDSVIAFPTALDRPRLERAIARAAAFWPNVCGRYVQRPEPGLTEGNDFYLDFTQSPIPFSTQSIEAEYPYPTKNVIQPNLGSFIPSLDSKYSRPNIDTPLVSLRLTTLLPSGTSVLGVRWGHILGDAASASRFIEHLSAFYVDISAEIDVDEMPSFEPHISLVPVDDDIRKKYMISQIEPLDLADVAAGYTNAAKISEMVTLHLTHAEMTALTAERKPNEYLSDQDFISGWWISVLERACVPIRRAVYTVNYRRMHIGHPNFPTSLPSLAANVAQMRGMDLPAPQPSETSEARILVVARAVRAKLIEIRNDPVTTIEWLSNAADAMGRAADRGQAACLVPKQDEVMINSNLRYDWAIKFGQPSANFHTCISILRFLRVFQANPRPGAEANGQRDVELVFNVERGQMLDDVSRIVNEDKAKWAATR